VRSEKCGVRSREQWPGVSCDPTLGFALYSFLLTPYSFLRRANS
jgi:hypothetical protein